YHDEITFILENWTQMMVPIEENIDIVYQLKEKGYPLYLLSNFHNEAIQEMFDKYEFFQVFDGHVISAHEHTMKPCEGIYHILLEKYNLDPHNCVFIDDSLANINTARHLGITGIHLPYLRNLKNELESIHIL
ncbi:MAG: HAD-IA family hydrolase, partial [Coprobacillus sp.]